MEDSKKDVIPELIRRGYQWSQNTDDVGKRLILAVANNLKEQLEPLDDSTRATTIGMTAGWVVGYFEGRTEQALLTLSANVKSQNPSQ